MATKLYFHSASSDATGTLPSSAQSSLLFDQNVDAQSVNRSMDTNIGVSQSSLSLTSSGGTTLKNYYFTKFISDPLNQTSIAANTWSYNFAASETGATANFPCSGTNVVYVCLYVWRPSTGTKIATILDGNSVSGYVEPSSVASEKVMTGTFTGAAATIAVGDVLVFEVWFQVTQAAPQVAIDQFYYDGTTESITANQTVSSHAAYISTPGTLDFSAPLTRVLQHNTLKYDIKKRVIQADTLKYNLRKTVTHSNTLLYSISILLRVVHSNTLLYHLRQQVKHSNTLIYYIYGTFFRISRANILLFNRRQRVINSDTLVYSILKLIKRPNSLRYSFYKQIKHANTLKYTIQSATTRVFHSNTLVYNIRKRVIQSDTLQYNILRRVLGHRTINYNLRKRVLHNNRFLYTIIQRTKHRITLLYNLLQTGVSAPGDFFPPDFLASDYLLEAGGKDAGATTQTPQYYLPHRPRVTIYNPDGVTVLAQFDAFAPNSTTIPVYDLDVNIGLGTAGTCDVYIHDTNNIINRNNIGLFTKIKIESGKFSNDYQDIHWFYVRNVEGLRTETGVFDYHLLGYGVRIRANERITNFIKSAAVSTFGTSNQIVNDPKMQANNLAKYLWTSVEHLPFQGPLENFDVSGISDDVVDVLPNINAPLTEFGALMDMICQYSGAIWYIDAKQRIVLKYPGTTDSGLTVKSGELELSTDLAANTSFIMSKLAFQTSSDIGKGYANTYFGTSQNTSADASQTKSGGSTSLHDIDITTQFPPGSTGIKDLSLLLSKTGMQGVTGFVNGRIVVDLAGLPIGPTAATFQINLSDINESATAIYKANLSIVNNAIPTGAPLWIILYKSDLFTDENNTVLWYNDGDVTTPNRLSAYRPIPIDSERNQANPDGWVVSSNGPKFVFAAFDRSVISVAATNPDAREKYLPIEAIYSPQWAVDSASLSKIMVATLNFSIRPKVTFDAIKCTVPDTLPQFGDVFTLVDALSGLNIKPIIQGIHYHWSSDSSGTNPLGTNFMEIIPLTYIDIGQGGL